MYNIVHSYIPFFVHSYFIINNYPPYHSKYNPVERIWARLEMMWNGFLLTSEEICN